MNTATTTVQTTSHPHAGHRPAAAPPPLQEAQQKVALLNERALSFVRERPVTCLVGAVALGFIVGKIAARN